jgi:oxygen-independent coproporphyrinogen-3 oxidase
MSQSLGLYVHVPFCVHKCGYCDFNSWAETRRAPQELWLSALQKQLEFWGPRAQAAGKTVDTIFWGGGTPSLLENDLLIKAGHLLAKNFPSHANLEWSFECNPETLSAEKIEALKAAGATRLSIGIQSFDDVHLERLERRARKKDNLRALEILKNNWSGPWSLDLMFGLPQQSAEHWKQQLQIALDFAPTHISAYQLTLTTARSQHWQQGSESELLEQFDITEELLEGAGLLRYEVSNFAKPGAESRHNLKYWRLEPFLGIGPGASGLLSPSLLTSGVQEFSQNQTSNLDAALSGRFNPLWGAHQKNPDSFETWLKGAGQISCELGQALNPREEKDHLFEMLMMGLRLKAGISISRLKPWAVQDESQLEVVLKEAQVIEFIEVNNDFLRVNGQGLRILDHLLPKLFKSFQRNLTKNAPHNLDSAAFDTTFK